MSSKLDYIQKHYLNGGQSSKKEKKSSKKLNKKPHNRLRIIDESESSWKTVSSQDDDIIDLEIDELPAVAEIVDDRPPEIVEIEKYSLSSSWKPLSSRTINGENLSTVSDRCAIEIKKEFDSDDDVSTARLQNDTPKRKRHDSSDASPPRKRHDSSDASPPRKRHDSSDASPPRKRHDSSDASPPRKRHDSSDASPPRKRHDSSDVSPPRKRHDSSDASPPRKRHDLSDVSPRKDKSKNVTSLDDTKNETIYRDRATGKKKEVNKELEAKQQLIQDKVAKWKVGAAQSKRRDQAADDAIHEMSKGFTRSTGDADLEKYLKEQTHEDDPMAAFLQKKKAKTEKAVVYPKYKGSWPANRFNIPPGYRWDGVDRSNGFEKKYFQSVNDRKAMTEIAHKWSVEDM